jgi:hypothetical protein
MALEKHNPLVELLIPVSLTPCIIISIYNNATTCWWGQGERPTTPTGVRGSWSITPRRALTRPAQSEEISQWIVLLSSSLPSNDNVHFEKRSIPRIQAQLRQVRVLIEHRHLSNIRITHPHWDFPINSVWCLRELWPKTKTKKKQPLQSARACFDPFC